MQYLYNTGKYEIAEHAAYADKSNPEHIQQAAEYPWSIYFNIPPSSDTEGRQRYKSSKENVFGGFLFEQTCLDFQPDVVFDIRDKWMCLADTTSIFTKNGVKYIKDIKIGDYVLTHTGKFKKVNKIFQRKYNGRCFKIKASNINETVDITENHEILVLKKPKPSLFKKIDSSKKEW